MVQSADQLVSQRAASSVEPRAAPAAPTAQQVQQNPPPSGAAAGQSMHADAVSLLVGDSSSESDLYSIADMEKILAARYGVLQGLPVNARPNGLSVRIGELQGDGRILTSRPASGDEIFVHPENVRELLHAYDEFAVGDDFGSDEVDGAILVAFDVVEDRWACVIRSDLGNDNVQTQFYRLPASALQD